MWRVICIPLNKYFFPLLYLLLTFCFDGCCVDREVGVSGHVSRPDDVLAEAPCHPCQTGGLQVKRLSGLYSKLGAATVPKGKAMRALK